MATKCLIKCVKERRLSNVHSKRLSSVFVKLPSFPHYKDPSLSLPPCPPPPPPLSPWLCCKGSPRSPVFPWLTYNKQFIIQKPLSFFLLKMDNKLNFVRNGVLMRLPPGFRFHPTDEELIVQYLKRKVMSFPLPASIIPEVDICKSDPWDLPGDSEQERYFFSTKEAKYPNGNRSNRATESGYWKATGIDKRIVVSKENQLVGMKKTLVFYRGKPPHGSKTDWIMHEYRLAGSFTTSADKPCKKIKPFENSEVDSAAMENWVLCRIFLKKKKGGKRGDESMNEEKERGDLGKTRPLLFFNFMAAAKESRTDLNVDAPVSSCSDSSGITAEFPPTHEPDDHEESSSCCNSFLPLAWGGVDH